MPRSTRRGFLRLALGLAAGASAGPAVRAAPKAPPLVEYGSPRTYAIVHRAVMTMGSVLPASLEIWLPVPQNQPEQDVGEVAVKPKVKLVPDVTGQALVAKRYASAGLPGADGTWSLELSYELTCRQIAANWPALRAAVLPPYRQDRQYELWTRPEKYIETRDPDIAAQAGRLKDRYHDPLSLARAAYDWVLQKVEYKLIDGVGGAVYCLKNGHGECGDYSALFVALLRAAGVPARTVAGFYADRIDAWHVWAEFMLPGGEWLPVDPSLGDQNARNREYFFGSLDNRRVAACKTMDVELVGKHPGQTKADFLQAGCMWWTTKNLPANARRPEVKLSVEGRPAKSQPK